MSTVSGGRRIPAEQLDALNTEVRESTAPVYAATADAIRSAYAIGYAAALGYEITVEDDQVRIGDRVEPPGPALTGPEWVTTPAEQHEREQAVIAAARQLAELIRVVGEVNPAVSLNEINARGHALVAAVDQLDAEPT